MAAPAQFVPSKFLELADGQGVAPSSRYVPVWDGQYFTPRPLTIDDVPGGSAAPGVEQDDFAVATNGQTGFTLTRSALPSSASVTINGLLQPDTEFSVSGNQFTFNSGNGIVAGDTVSVRYNY